MLLFHLMSFDVLSILINNNFQLKKQYFKKGVFLLCSVSVSFIIALSILKFLLTELRECLT